VVLVVGSVVGAVVLVVGSVDPLEPVVAVESVVDAVAVLLESPEALAPEVVVPSLSLSPSESVAVAVTVALTAGPAGVTREAPVRLVSLPLSPQAAPRRAQTVSNRPWIRGVFIKSTSSSDITSTPARIRWQPGRDRLITSSNKSQR